VGSGKSKDEIGAYYFQTRSSLAMSYLPDLARGKWEEWRKDWLIASTDDNERLDLPTNGPTSDRKDWRARPKLAAEFDPILNRIRSLVEGGLSSMHVLGDFLKRRIAPLQQRPRPVWIYTGPNDCGRVDRGVDTDLTRDALEIRVQGVTSEDFVPEVLVLPAGIVPLCEDQQLRTTVLRSMPTLDDGGLAARQSSGDPNQGIQIPGVQES